MRLLKLVNKMMFYLLISVFDKARIILLVFDLVCGGAIERVGHCISGTTDTFKDILLDPGK